MKNEINKVYSLMGKMGLIVEDNSLLLEVMTPKDLYNKLKRNGIDISEETFNYVLSIDPFSTGNKVGKLANWFFNLKDLYYNDYDLEFLEEPFKKYYTLSQRKKLTNDLNQLQNIKSDKLFIELLDNIDLDDDSMKSNRQVEKEIKENEVEVFYDDGNWLVLIPLTERASCYYGKNTKWCTASKDSDDNQFYNYNQQGPLYIFIDLNDKDYKYQLHLQTGEFTDAQNNAVNILDLDLPNSLLEQLPENNMLMIQDGVIVVNMVESKGQVVLMLDNGKNCSITKGGYPMMVDEDYGNVIDYFMFVDYLSVDVKRFIMDSIDNEDVEPLMKLRAVVDWANNTIKQYNPSAKEMLIIEIDTGQWSLFDSDNFIIKSGYIYNMENKSFLDYIIYNTEVIIEQIDNIYLHTYNNEHFYVDDKNNLYAYDSDSRDYHIINDGDWSSIDVKQVPQIFSQFINSLYE